MALLEIGPETTMAAILTAYPSAKIGLFQRYHIGGCASSGYAPTDTLEAVCQTHRITDPLEIVIDCIRESAALEAQLHIGPEDVALALDKDAPPRLIDVRTPGEWEAGHLPGAQLLTPELTFEILDSWRKNAPSPISTRAPRSTPSRARAIVTRRRTRMSSCCPSHTTA